LIANWAAVIFSLQISPSRATPSKGMAALLIESSLSLVATSKLPLTQRSIRLKRSASSVHYAILQIYITASCICFRNSTSTFSKSFVQM
jgi:hypothetical protein